MRHGVTRFSLPRVFDRTGYEVLQRDPAQVVLTVRDHHMGRAQYAIGERVTTPTVPYQQVSLGGRAGGLQ